MNTLFLHLTLITGIGPGTIEKLLSNLPKDFNYKNFYSFKVQDFRCLGISEKAAQCIVEGLRDTQVLEKELHLIEKHKIQWCTICDAEYPQQLKEIHLPPLVLYYQGTIQNITEHSVAFVGARKANFYGKKITRQLVSGMVSFGWVIVSGGAYGVDTWAHQTAVEAQGVTAVVLGSGLLRQYPQENKKLFTSVVENNGVILSSFPLQMEPYPGNFPARNRIIAGLSKATIVVQAAAKSGALITAQYALEQGRSVGAVPGSLDDPLSAGCHALLSQGAKLIQKADDILEECGIAQQRVSIALERPQESDPLIILCQKPQTLGSLQESTKMTENKLNERLFELQLEGKIEQNFAGLWESR